ncbi:hypothetical protein K6V18_00010 [Ralstonia insidiosa]|uniref:hypothetical protein n=1 Tax=Ralstonia TaxID=48736 RepID=UPI00066E9067|nr:MULTISPECIES: hypothetical protein [Ralstonia]MBY4703391.1 hypothetical protein [Ralstonia insidiosa]GAQ31618.1 hypothetical protein SAMD00023378_5301 [Ralstonia sp. NT80]
MAISRKSAFVPQPPDTPVSELALRVLVEFADGDAHVIGTATLIATHLALTAQHVVDDILTRFGHGELKDNAADVTEYSIRLYQVLPGGHYAIWNVYTAWKCPGSDLALLHLGLFGQSDPNTPINWRTPPLIFTAPPVGTPIAAFGYHSSVVATRPADEGGYHMELKDKC